MKLHLMTVLQINSFQKSPWKKVKQQTLEIVFVQFFERGWTNTESLNYHGNHHYKNQHLTHIVLMSEASNALEFAVVASKLQCLSTVDHIEKPSLSWERWMLEFRGSFSTKHPKKKELVEYHISKGIYHSKFKETCAQIPTLHVSLVSKQIFTRRNTAYI